MRTILIALALVLGSAGAAHAKQHRFVGEHPASGGGFCHINAPHVHVYAPARADVLYRQHDGWSHFVGDPVAYGYEGPKFAYEGPHPVHVDVILGETDVDGDEVEYCYLRGPHYHISAPPPSAHFELKGGLYWYVEPMPPEFVAARPRYATINAVYEPIVYNRPIVTVEPPHGWVDVYVAAPVVVVASPPPPPPPEAVGVGVGVGVGVSVKLPVPVIGVHVEGGHHHHGEKRGHGKVKIKGRF